MLQEQSVQTNAKARGAPGGAFSALRLTSVVKFWLIAEWLRLQQGQRSRLRHWRKCNPVCPTFVGHNALACAYLPSFQRLFLSQAAIHDHRYLAKNAATFFQRLQSRTDCLHSAVDGLADMRNHQFLRCPVHRQDHSAPEKS